MIENRTQAPSRRRPGAVETAVLTVIASSLVVYGVEAQGQEGPLATLGVSLGAQYAANDPDDDESSLSTGLSFNLSKATRTQSFDVSASGRFVLDEDGFDFETPSLSLGYTRENRSTAFDIGASYSIRDVEGDREIIDPDTLTVIDLIDDDGTLETFQFSTGLETGRDEPFGTDTRFTYTDRSYSDTSDPDLTDFESWQIGTTLRFDLDPRIGMRASASLRETQEDDVERTESRSVRVGVGGTFLIDPLWTASADIGYSVFEDEEGQPGNRVVTEQDGTTFVLSVSRQFRDGTLGVSVARDISDIGVEDSLRILRDREFANGGELSWAVGLVTFPNGETRPIASASYSVPMPRGRFGIDLVQASAVNGDDDSVVTTSLGVNYSQTINATSSWSLNASYTDISVIGTSDEGQTRAEAGVSYNHALTRDWDLSAGLRHRITSEDGERDNSASTLSLSLERNFSFRP